MAYIWNALGKMFEYFQTTDSPPDTENLLHFFPHWWTSKNAWVNWAFSWTYFGVSILISALCSSLWKKHSWHFMIYEFGVSPLSKTKSNFVLKCSRMKQGILKKTKNAQTQNMPKPKFHENYLFINMEKMQWISSGILFFQGAKICTYKVFWCF